MNQSLVTRWDRQGLTFITYESFTFCFSNRIILQDLNFRIPLFDSLNIAISERYWIEEFDHYLIRLFSTCKIDHPIFDVNFGRNDSRKSECHDPTNLKIPIVAYWLTEREMRAEIESFVWSTFFFHLILFSTLWAATVTKGCKNSVWLKNVEMRRRMNFGGKGRNYSRGSSEWWGDITGGTLLLPLLLFLLF